MLSKPISYIARSIIISENYLQSYSPKFFPKSAPQSFPKLPPEQFSTTPKLVPNTIPKNIFLNKLPQIITQNSLEIRIRKLLFSK